jgi:hypothetical protein
MEASATPDSTPAGHGFKEKTARFRVASRKEKHPPGNNV